MTAPYFAANRRQAIIAGVATVAGLAGTARATDSAAPAKQDQSQKVWLDMDQAALDAAYTQPKYAPNFAQVIKRYASNSEAMRARIGQPERYSYGPSAIERLEVYKTRHENAPVHIHVHGGAWLQRPATEYAFPAEIFTNSGIHYVVFDFISVDEAGGSLAPMVGQVRRAIAWVRQNAAKFGGDPDRIYLSGFSSGSHLASVALISDWQEFGLPQNFIKGALLCSGIYELYPVRLSVRSKYVTFSNGVEQEYSTQRHLERFNTPVIFAHGTYETPEFQRQTREFAALLQAAGKSAQLIVGENYNHFEMMETLGNPFGILGRAALSQIS